MEKNYFESLAGNDLMPLDLWNIKRLIKSQNSSNSEELVDGIESNKFLIELKKNTEDRIVEIVLKDKMDPEKVEFQWNEPQ